VVLTITPKFRAAPLWCGLMAIVGKSPERSKNPWALPERSDDYIFS
jgi:hypothetical protein